MYREIDKSGSQSMKLDHYWWKKNVIYRFYPFSNHDTSNIPNLSNPTINLSLEYQTKCDNMFSDPQSDHIFSHISRVRTWFIHFFFWYVVSIHLIRIGEGVGIYCPLITNWIELTKAQILFLIQIQNWDTEPNSKYFLKEYLNIAWINQPHFI